jgi:hypothetical protein
VLVERVDERRARVRHQQHVALVNRRPSANAGAVHAEAFFEGLLIELADGIRNVVLKTGQVGEAQVQILTLFFLMNSLPVSGRL